MAAKPLPVVRRRMLDYPGLAEYLSVGESTARRLAAEGSFPKVKIGGSVRFDVADVDAYIDRIKAAG